MTRAIILAIVLLLASCNQPYLKQPPKANQADNSAQVVFATSPDVACRRMGAITEVGQEIQGCQRGGVIVLPNPCAWPNRSDYADVACHELGHLDGWPANHPG